MRKESSLPVRLDTELSRRLAQAAERLGLTKSSLIRILVKSFVDQLEASGGQVTLPLHWQKPQRNMLRYVAESRPRYGGNKGKR